MKVRLGDYYAKCPYCGSTDFLGGDDAASAELACARCGGYASRRLLLDRIADEAIVPANGARLKSQRRPKGVG